MSLLLDPKRVKSNGLYHREDIHIYRDPQPASIHTRKYEPVQMGDVQYLIRECPDRISDNILKYPRSQNIKHSNGTRRNHGNSMYGQYGTPYKVKVVRPPLIRPVYDTLPLSRMKHPNITAWSNPGFPYQTRTEIMKQIDISRVKTSVWSLPRPAFRFTLGDLEERPNVTSYIHENIRSKSWVPNAVGGAPNNNIPFVDLPLQRKRPQLSVSANARGCGVYNKSEYKGRMNDKINVSVDNSRRYRSNNERTLIPAINTLDTVGTSAYTNPSMQVNSIREGNPNIILNKQANFGSFDRN